MVPHHPILAFLARTVRLTQKQHLHVATTGHPVVKMPPKPEPTADQRKQMVPQLLLQVKEDAETTELRRVATISVASDFDIKSKTISRIWRRACQSCENPAIGAFQSLQARRWASEMRPRCCASSCRRSPVPQEKDSGQAIPSNWSALHESVQSESSQK